MFRWIKPMREFSTWSCTSITVQCCTRALHDFLWGFKETRGWCKISLQNGALNATGFPQHFEKVTLLWFLGRHQIGSQSDQFNFIHLAEQSYSQWAEESCCWQCWSLCSLQDLSLPFLGSNVVFSLEKQQGKQIVGVFGSIPCSAQGSSDTPPLESRRHRHPQCLPLILCLYLEREHKSYVIGQVL